MRRLLTLWFVPWLFAAGCEEEEENRPAPYPECEPTEPNCDPIRPPPVTSRGGTSGTAGEAGRSGDGGTDGGSAGSAGEGGADGGAPPLSVDIDGTVARYVGLTFSSVTRYSRSAVLEAEGSEKSTVSTTWEGSGSFLLRGVRNQEPIWLSVRPEAATSTDLRTLHAMIDVSDSVNVPIVGREVIEQVFAALSGLPQLLSDRAQAALVFTDRDGRALADIVAELPAAEVIAYARNSGWTDGVRNGTDLSGLVLLGNISARKYPGNDVRVDFSGAKNGFADLRIAAGAVTVTKVVAR